MGSACCSAWWESLGFQGTISASPFTLQTPKGADVGGLGFSGDLHMTVSVRVSLACPHLLPCCIPCPPCGAAPYLLDCALEITPLCPLAQLRMPDPLHPSRLVQRLPSWLVSSSRATHFYSYVPSAPVTHPHLGGTRPAGYLCSHLPRQLGCLPVMDSQSLAWGLVPRRCSAILI